MRIQKAFILCGMSVFLFPSLSKAVTMLNTATFLVSGDTTQSNRLTRTAVPSDWSASKTFPGESSAGSIHYRTFSVAFGSASFAQVFLDDPQNVVFASAYLDSYSPASKASNYLGDAGSSGSPFGNPGFFQVNVSAGHTLIVVVNEVASGGGINRPFTLRVEAFTDTQYTDPASVPGVVSVSPNSGGGTGPLTFTAQYSDSGGAYDLQVVYLFFGSVGDSAHNCKVAYVQGSNQLYLFDDNNVGVLGPLTEGGGGSVSNTQCTLSGGVSTAITSGIYLTVPYTVTFLAGYGGKKTIFELAQSYSGVQSAFTSVGTWTPAPSTPSVTSVNPINGSGAGPQVFTAVFSDTGGANDLQEVYLDFGSVYFAAHDCIVVYVPGPNQLYLFTDNGSTAVGPISEGAGGGTLSNSQCTLASGSTAAALSGNTLAVPFNITFKSGYGGRKTVFALAQTYAAVQSNGGVPNALGFWTPAASTPSVVSVTPINSSGPGPQTFTAVYSDTGGATDLQGVYLTFGSVLNGAGTCAVGYIPGNNQLFLFNDAGTAAATLGLGGGGSVTNSQCTLSGGAVGATLSGGADPPNLSVPFSITFKAGFTGAKSVLGFAQTYNGTQSGSPAGTPTNLGSWTP
jgi:hypothetical protein